MKMKNESDSGLTFIKVLFEKIFAIKYIYLASVLMFVTLAFFYVKFSPKVYELFSTIGPVKDTRSSVLVPNEFSASYTTGRFIEDAINNLYSFDLISQTVNNLNLEIGYFVDSSRIFKQFTEIYLESPFIVNIDKSHIQTIGARFYISFLSESAFRITASEKETILYNYLDKAIVAEDQPLHIDTICKFNETYSNRNFKFSISPNKEFLSGALTNKKDYYFELYNPDELAKNYLKQLNVDPISYMASIIKVQFSSKNLQKSLNFLNSFVNLFLEENLGKKNKIAISTINFIDNQISEMSDSLVESESRLRNFRSDNMVMDLSYQGQQLYGQMELLGNERTNLEQQSRYYNYVLNFLKTNQDISGITPPSTSNITDPIINKLFEDLFALNAERSTISNVSGKNIFLAQIENRIKIQKQTLTESVTNNLNALNLTLNELNYKIEKLSREISNLPRQEMRMVNIQRKFNLNNTSYTFLLQKRSESAIALASTYPDFEVLEPAREITSKIIKPRVKLSFIFSLFLGLLFPSIFLISRDIFSDKINSIYDFERFLDHSIFSIIYNNPRKYDAVFTESPRSAIAESFRNLRSSLFLKLKSDQSKIIIVTSPQPQDGKSFISFNLAASIASVGLKTVIVDCDLRRPMLHLKFKVDNSFGISNFLMNSASVDEIVHKTSVENLFFIPAGPFQQNASELFSTRILDNLFDKLKSKYEYIIVDTPPIGLVSDTVQLMKYASQILIITKMNSTKKDLLSSALTSLNSNNINNYEVVLNNLAIAKSPYSSYKSYYLKE